MSDLKITAVEAIYLRLPQVKTQCDSGQDALLVKVSTNAGITGYGEVDSNPIAVKGCIEGPFSHTTATGLAHVVIGEDPFQTEYLWHKMYRANIYGGRRGIGDPRDQRHRPGALGHQGQGPRHAGLEAARRRVYQVAAGLRQLALRRHARRKPAIAPGGLPTRDSRP